MTRISSVLASASQDARTFALANCIPALAMDGGVDTAQTDQIGALKACGPLDGVTANPSLIAKARRNFKDVVAEICAMIDGPVSATVAAANVATVPPDLIRGLIPDPLTDSGLTTFTKDWAATGQSIH